MTHIELSNISYTYSSMTRELTDDGGRGGEEMLSEATSKRTENGVDVYCAHTVSHNRARASEYARNGIIVIVVSMMVGRGGDC